MPYYESTTEHNDEHLSSSSFRHGQGHVHAHAFPDGDDDIMSDLDGMDINMDGMDLGHPIHSSLHERFPSAADDFSMSGGSTTVGSHSGSSTAFLSRSETRVLSSAKCIVLACLLSLAGGVSYIWFIFAQRYEEDVFRAQFRDASDHLEQVFLDRVHHSVQTSATVATAFTSSLLLAPSHAAVPFNGTDADIITAANENQWPFVTFSDFERRVAASRRLLQASSVWFIPFVATDQRALWETYAADMQYALPPTDFQDPVVDFDYDFESHSNSNSSSSTSTSTSSSTSSSASQLHRSDVDWPIAQGMYRIQDDAAVSDDAASYSHPFYAPTWQVSPYSVANTTTMFNQMSEELRMATVQDIRATSRPLYSPSQLESTPTSLLKHHQSPSNDGNSNNDSDSNNHRGPYVSLYTPVHESFQDESSSSNNNVVAAISFQFYWIHMLQDAIHGIPSPLYVQLESTCNPDQLYSYKVSDQAVSFLHSTNSNKQMLFNNHLNLELQSTFEDFQAIINATAPSSSSSSICSYRITVTPTQEYQDEYLTNQPTLSAIGVAGIFILTAAVFIVYDCLVEKRQKKVMQFAKRSNAIVRSLFPAGVRDRLMQEGKNGKQGHGLTTLPASYLPMQTPKLRLKTYLNDDNASTDGNINTNGGPGNETNGGTRQSTTLTTDQQHQQHQLALATSDPIADFWPNTTVLFADLSGFTAWSSTREPSQVFTLLETLYGAMDKAARRLGVFKVETVGDCYVAATGLPDPRDDHAILMVRFASVCLTRINELTRTLEAALGPGTGDLAMRMGIHSGPVTAGVLRGEKSRFQLFGDTMNTAARLESTGTRNRVHLSKETADLLSKGGKGHWLEKRQDKIEVKGKGTMQTFWLKPRLGSPHDQSVRSTSRTSDSGSESTDDVGINARAHTTPDETSVSVESMDNRRRDSNSSSWNENDRQKRLDRLVEWNVEILSSLLRQIVAKRSAAQSAQSSNDNTTLQGKVVLDEVKEVIAMPNYDPKVAVKIATETSSLLPPSVRRELREYIHRIAGFYNDNPFHNFEHASHVCLSANKLLKRIVMPDDVDYRRDSQQEEIDKLLAVSADLHNVTYGISSDPVTQFAVVFSALIHDTGHTGVPNPQLAKEEPETATMYRNQSIAEQRSVDLAWNLLMDSEFDNLRACLFPTNFELTHFRQLIVNSVLATDIFDPQMTKLRKARWQKAFHPSDGNLTDSEDEAFNRKATIVIEHIIQASDVAHTMQHWHVYQKWNERLFQEMYAAYKEGRAEKDPSLGWYKGELWFFDNYVIPLAHKLKECGVFGVSSAEYLTYALANREEWEAKGERVCERMVGNFEESRFARLSS